MSVEQQAPTDRPTDHGVSAPGAPRPVTPNTILARMLIELCDGAGVDDLDPALRDGLLRARDLATGLDPYLSRLTSPESPALARLSAATAAEDWSGRSPQGTVGALEQEMLSGHVEGQTLRMLVHATRSRRVLEVGMFTGYSALAMAEALTDDGEVVACEIDVAVADFARRHLADSAAGRRVRVEVGPAEATLERLAADGEVFDLVFIDADKAGYACYLDLVLDRGLLAAHGLVCVDNTLMQGEPWTTVAPTPNGRAITAFNEAVAADPRVEQVVLPLRDGLTLIRRSEEVHRAS